MPPKFWSPKYTDFSKYKEATEEDESPKAAIIMIADSSLLFWKEEGFAWVNVSNFFQ